MNLFSKEMKGTYFHNMSEKDQKLKRKLTFDIPKFKFQNELEWTTSFFFGFFETNRSVGAHPPKKCASIFADSESCEQWGDFGT